MNRLFAGSFLLTVTFLAGCNQGTPGGPGATGTADKKSAYQQANDTFNLKVPILATNLKQGERKATSIGIKRGKNFNEDVSLKFAAIPKGITLDPSSAVIKHGDEEAKLTLVASNDASLGDFTINVTGHPSKGGDATIGFKIAVDKK
jgi:hypothetical protein